MASHHPLRPVSKAFTMILLGYFSDIFHCHTFYLGFLYLLYPLSRIKFGLLLYPLSRMFFSPGHQKAHTHISFSSLFRSSPVGEAFLKHYSLCFLFSLLFFFFFFFFFIVFFHYWIYIIYLDICLFSVSSSKIQIP